MTQYLPGLCAIAALLTFGCSGDPALTRDDAQPATSAVETSSQLSSQPDLATPPSPADPVERVVAELPSETFKNPALEAKSDTAPGADIPKSAGEVQLSLKFLSWNVESEGSDPATIARQLKELGSYDVIALTEVLPQAALDFCSACGDPYNYVMSQSGRNDRMMLIYNSQTLNFMGQFELQDINYKSRYRSPLVARFEDALTGRELLVMVNHLARGSEKTRQIQAKKLVEWGRKQTLPVVALGDYNFDYVFETRKGNESFRLFMKDNVWQWIEPIELIDTNWYDNPEEPDGKDDYPGSMLDFGFVAGEAKEWTTSCKIIVRDGDFPDDETTSDHRPFEVLVSGK